MKKITILCAMILLAFCAQGQSMKEKLAAKMAGGGGGGGPAKTVEAPDGEYSDASGLSGTYYANTPIPYGDSKKVATLVKLEYVAESNKVIFHAAKNETDPDVFWMADYMQYARDNYMMSQFKAGDFHLFTVEPGVVVFGAYKWAPEGYPGKTDKMMIADTSKLMPVILAKDQATAAKYTSADAKRIIGERGTLAEVANSVRIGEKTNLPSIGKMSSDKDLINKSVALMKAKWATSKEPANFQGCYIYNNDWGPVQYGKIMSTSKTTFSDEVTAIMLFKEASSGLCYYYAVGISREREDLTANGITTERGLQMTGESSIQYITEQKLQTCLKEIGQ